MSRFVFENHADNAVTVTASDNGVITIAVSEEQAVDSYNSTFECSIVLPAKQANLLLDYLNQALKKR